MKDTCRNQNCNQGRDCPDLKPKESAMPTHGQSKSMSMVEAVVNTVVGLGVAMVATASICKAYGIPMTWENNFIITFWMTVLSVLRSYLLRRLFNWRSDFFMKGWSLRRKWLEWKYRHQDYSVCCCGCEIGTGGDICGHGGCRSMRDYVIEAELALPSSFMRFLDRITRWYSRSGRGAPIFTSPPPCKRCADRDQLRAKFDEESS